MDWIQGNKFIDAADFTYSPEIKHMDDYYNLPNTFNEDKLKDVNIVFTTPFYAKSLMELVSTLSQRFVVITHNGDNSIEDNGVGFTDGKAHRIHTDVFNIPDNVVKWYATNVNTLNSKIEGIPSGLENERWHPEQHKKEKMLKRLEEPRDIKNLVYMDFTSCFNMGVRLPLLELLGDKPWVSAFRDKPYDFDRFTDCVYNHKFVVCPQGNGIGTHREWETLYMGSIPIQKRDLNNRFYTELPFCFVDDWTEVTEDFLNGEYERIRGREWKMEMLTFAYWKNKIRNTN